MNPNPIQDENDWYGYDHSGDANTRRVWSMMAGPNVPANMKVGSESNQIGKTTDNVLTIAEIFGIKDAVLGAGFMDGGTKSLFDRI